MIACLSAWRLQPLTMAHQAYSKKALFTIKIRITHLQLTRSAGMLRKTGICPYIWWFWAGLGRSGWFSPYIGRYGLGSRWYDHIRPYIGQFILYTLLSLYIRIALHILRDHHLASVHSVILRIYTNIYSFLYITSNVSKRH